MDGFKFGFGFGFDFVARAEESESEPESEESLEEMGDGGLAGVAVATVVEGVGRVRWTPLRYFGFTCVA